MMPQNQWLSAAPRFPGASTATFPSLFWAFSSSCSSTAARKGRQRLPLDVADHRAELWLLYPVVLWADTIPMIGMLMIPKTCAYVCTVLIGYRAMKQECK